jgi:hypothetical protein
LVGDMGFLARLFGGVSKAERDGIELREAAPWEVSGTRDVERFLRALPVVFPDDSIVYFEGTGEPHVAEYLERISIPAQVQVAVGTIWPRPDRYHVPLTKTEGLAAFLDDRPAGYFCTHCHVYRVGAMLPSWHDAFADDPFLVSRTVGAEAIAAFANRLGCSYRVRA